MVFTIKTDKERYHYQALKVMQNLPPFNTLREKELQVFAQLLYHDMLLEESGVYNEQIRHRILFDIETKAKICTALNISEAVMRNNIHILRRKGFLDGVTINPKVKVRYATELVFNFTDKEIEMTEIQEPQINPDFIGDDLDTEDRA